MASTMPCSTVQPAAAGMASRKAPFARPLQRKLAHSYVTAVEAYRLRPKGSSEVVVSQDKYVIGSGPAADLKVQGPNVAADHAELQQKGKQVFLKALVGESVFDRTYTWVDDAEVRPMVSYVLASGSTVAFGDQQQCYTVEFDEPSGANPLVEMMMQGMAASADPQVKKELSSSDVVT